MTGWLVEQLPRVMAKDDMIRGLVLALEQVADSVRDRAASMEQQIDVDLATPEVLRFLGAWLGEDLEAHGDGARERELVRVIGRTLTWRGTRHGVEEVLRAATGTRVRVDDAGGVFGRDDRLPPPDLTVHLSVGSEAPDDLTQLRAFAEAELPVGAVLMIDVADAAQTGAEHG